MANNPANVVRCAMCGQYVPKSEAFLDCPTNDSRPMWLCAHCDYEAQIFYMTKPDYMQ